MTREEEDRLSEAIRRAVLVLSPSSDLWDIERARNRLWLAVDRAIDLKEERKKPGAPRELTPKQAAAQLRDLAGALKKAINIANDLSGYGVFEIGQIRKQRGVRWDFDKLRGERSIIIKRIPRGLAPLGGGELQSALDAVYPGLFSILEEAANNIDRLNTGGRPKGRDPVFAELAEGIAYAFHELTGEMPSHSRSETKFSRFVIEMFDLAGIAEGQAIHYASVGAKSYKDRVSESR
jgi:hypothetical protein